MKQKLHTLALILFAAMQLAAQPIIKNQAIFGGKNRELNPHIALQKNGGLIMVMESYSNTSGNKSENNRDTTGLTSDYWVVKLNAMGHIEWDKTFGGDNYDIPPVLCDEVTRVIV